jgi:PAS domain S-box-containing protein
MIGASLLLQGVAFWRLLRFGPGAAERWPWRLAALALAFLLAGRVLALAPLPWLGAWAEFCASLGLCIVLWSQWRRLGPSGPTSTGPRRLPPEGSGRFPADEQRQAAAHRLQMATRAARLGVWEVDIRKGCLIWDEATQAQFGRSEADQPASLDAWGELVHEEDQASFRQGFAAALRGDGDLDLRLRSRSPDGSLRHFRLVGHSLVDGAGRVIRLLGICQDFTHRVQADLSLLEAEQRFRSLFESMSEGVALHETLRDGAGTIYEYRILEVNPAFFRQTGIPGERASGQVASKVYGADWPLLRGAFEKVAASGDPGHLELFLPALNRHLKLSVFRPREARVAAVFQDISERRRSELAVKASQERLQLILDSTAEGLYGVDTQGLCTFCNPACLRMLGYDEPEELLGRSMHTLIHHSHRDGTSMPVEDCRIYKAYQDGIGVQVEDEVFWRKDGSCFPVEYWSYPQRTGGVLVGAVVGFLDRSRRERWEAENRRLNQFLESVIQNADVWMNVLDNEANVALWNRAAERISGYSQAEVMGSGGIWAWLYPDEAYRASIGAKVSAILQEGAQVRGFETTIRTKAGEDRVITWDSRALVDEAGIVTGSIAIGRDITESKAAEEQLRKISDSIPVMVYQLLCRRPEDWSFAFVNSRVREMYGVSPEEAKLDLAFTLGKVHPADVGEVVRSSQESIRALTRWSLDFRVVLDGVARWHHGESVPEAMPDGSVIVTGYFQDITERKEAEGQREALMGELASKNKELETVVYVASHDLRSPLVNILGFSQRLEKALKDAETLLRTAPAEGLRERLEPLLCDRIPDSLRYILASGSKMDGLINGLLKISRAGRTELNPETLDMNAMVKAILDSMTFQLQKAEAKIALGDLPPCRGDASQVGQVISNLVDNAIKYRDPSRPLRISIEGEVQGAFSVYQVEDTGLGIPAEGLEKIWTLFHRLAPGDAVGGEGLGLALVQRMTERNGGRAWVESEPGRGSRFFVALPIP